MRNGFYLLLFLLILLAWNNWENRAIDHAPGVLVPETPRQTEPADAKPFRLDGFILTPRADFRIRARVLSRENYYWGDDAGLAPVDLALGWGVMSDQAVLDRIEITQGGRWYFTRYEHPAPLHDQDIIRHSGNMHMIPANDWVRDKLKSIRPGQLIEARGRLVDVDHESGFYWRTSLTREDTGGGSCELFYVEQLFIEDSDA
jgi:hypothetical protein